MTRAAQQFLVAQLCACLASCNADGPQEVEFSSNKNPIGDWPAPERDAATDEATTPPARPGTSGRDAGGQDAEVEDDDGGVEMGGDGPGTVEPPQPPAMMPADAGPAARLSFSVLTHVQHMRLKLADPAFDDDARGPKNMGAIWISKPDGTFVRSLELWRRHKERSRHLVAYNAACECPKPDVVATATLNQHKEHVVRWDMTDRTGKPAPEGKYTLHVEVADYDVDKPERADLEAKNAMLDIDFDTETAPSKIAVESTEFLSDIELELFQ